MEFYVVFNNDCIMFVKVFSNYRFRIKCGTRIESDDRNKLSRACLFQIYITNNCTILVYIA